MARPASQAAPGFAERTGLTGLPSRASHAGLTVPLNRAAVSPWMTAGAPAPADQGRAGRGHPKGTARSQSSG